MRRLALVALLLCGCPLSHSDFPGTACEKNTDCFIGQGEVCNQETGQCQPMVDAAPIPDRPPVVDRPDDGADPMDGADQ